MYCSQAVIKSADMSEELQQEAVNISNEAIEKNEVEKDIAAYIKKVSLIQGLYRLSRLLAGIT